MVSCFFIAIIFNTIVTDNLSNLTWQTDVFHQTSKSNVDDETCCNRTNSSRCTLKFCDCSVEEQIKCYFNESNFSRLGYIHMYLGLILFRCLATYIQCGTNF